VQPWGRFLEVAPKFWNGSPWKCMASGFAYNLCSDGYSSDGGTEFWDGSKVSADGYGFCAPDSAAMGEHVRFAAPADVTGGGFGDGRANTALLLKEALCTTGVVDRATYEAECQSLDRCKTAQSSVLTAAASYLGGGLSDWYLPSLDELLTLCRYDGRDAIGGFWNSPPQYASSTTRNYLYGTQVALVEMSTSCDAVWQYPKGTDDLLAVKLMGSLVRPVRAFVGPVVVSESVCRDWPAGTTVMPCEVGAMGPGGGRVFYDAGSKQWWGRFLEVAPQEWNGRLFKCPTNLLNPGQTCGAAAGVPVGTSDLGANDAGDVGKAGNGYGLCAPGSAAAGSRVGFTSPANLTGKQIGSGLDNTRLLLVTPECNPSGAVAATFAVGLAAGYRGGGLDDWYVPSLDEIAVLCRFGARDRIGGFVDGAVRGYLSSSTINGSYGTEVSVESMTGDCKSDYVYPKAKTDLAVRPIRKFS